MYNAGAVIAAAGMSSRMKEFKQLMDVGGISMAEQTVRGFQEAGIREIVMVTGYRAEEVERRLSGAGILFLRNPDYEHSDMFASAKIGFAALADRCDRIFFCPADIPLFAREVIPRLLSEDADIVIPSRERHAGHPILLRSELIPGVLQYEGSGGLRAALASLSASRTYVEVRDEGSFLDADTPEDYVKLTEFYRRNRA